MNAKVMKETTSNSLVVSHFGTVHSYYKQEGTYTLTENFYPTMLRCIVDQTANVEIEVYVFRGETSLVFGKNISKIVWGEKSVTVTIGNGIAYIQLLG